MSGKSQLFKELRATAKSFPASNDQATTVAPAEALIFWAAADDLPGFWEPYGPLAELIQAIPMDLAQLAEDLKFAFEDVLAEQNSFLARAYRTDEVFPEFRYAISPTGQVELTDEATGYPERGVHTGNTCRCALYLALNWALRKRIPHGKVYPFVVDDRLAAMDNLQLDGLSRLMRAISRQVILIGSPGALLPDIPISHRLESGEGERTTVVVREKAELI